MPRKMQSSSQTKVDKSSEIIPVSERYALTINDATMYFGIGENSLRRIVKENKESNFVIRIGNRSLIIRKLFEEFLAQNNTEL